MKGEEEGEATATTTTIPAVGLVIESECGNCTTQRRLLHHVKIRGAFRRLCTSCVLRLHPSSFCPSCFQFYDSASIPALSKRLTCSKCSSFTHTHCLSQSPETPYLCPPCASPAFSFFDNATENRLALLLLCAAKISSASMAKALAVARGEAERRVRDAAVARKRAREAIENLVAVVGKAPRVLVHANEEEVKMEIDHPPFN